MVHLKSQGFLWAGLDAETAFQAIPFRDHNSPPVLRPILPPLDLYRTDGIALFALVASGVDRQWIFPSSQPIPHCSYGTIGAPIPVVGGNSENDSNHGGHTQHHHKDPPHPVNIWPDSWKLSQQNRHHQHHDEYFEFCISKEKRNLSLQTDSA